jgi:hypothetical protein
MPSTYSPDLRIELIANGEQSGTWGTTTNNNLGTLIEDAIAGAATVTVASTNQALTAANGAADEARCAVLVLDTLTGAPFNIFAPPVTKTYIIKNDSAYNAVIYCSTVLGNTTPAGAGYDIPAGKAVFVRCDGTEFTDGINHIQNGFTLDIPLTVTSGGTGLGTLPALSVPVANSLDTLSALTAAANQSIRVNSSGTAWEAYTPAGGGGSVSSVGLSMPVSLFTVSGSPVTTTGTLTAALNSQTANLFFAAPDGSAGAPTFRAISSADLPNSGAVASTYGNSTNVPQITVDAKGRVTSVTNVAISGGGGGVTSISASSPLNASSSTGAVSLSINNAGSGSAGVVTTSTQNFAGTKIFDTGLISGNGYNFTSNSSLFWTGIEAQIRIAGNMRFFVNNSSAGFDLSDVQKVGGGTFNSYSDSRYKQDISSYTKGLAEIKQVQPKNYRYTAEFMKSDEPSQAFVGVVAQELENTAFANCVRADADGYKVVDTSELTYALINAVKELSAKVEQLEAQLNAM